MNSALYIGATGMKTHAEGLNVVTNNLANVSTVGFKQQMATFSDLMYKGQGSTGSGWNATDDSYVAIGQVGMGVQVDAVRTSFTQGAFETSNTLTDLAIGGIGFFQVTGLEGETLYTRAGNFRLDEAGFLQLPGGEVLNGYPIDDTGAKGTLGPIQLNPFDVMPGSASTQVQLGLNLGNISDASASATDPYFSMAKSYDPTAPNPAGTSSYTQPIQIYDANGEKQELTLYVDGTPTTAPEKVMEFFIASNDTANGATPQALMTGTLTFNAAGELVDMSAFTPTDPTTTQDLTTWTTATLSGGSPQLNFNGQNITINFGLTAEGDWTNPPATAADVGIDSSLLPSMGKTILASDATTAYAGSNSQFLSNQDGYGEGSLTSMDIRDDGRIVGIYTNGQTQDLYEIPIARFTSEDGLHREGGNFFSATSESGLMELGVAGTENYGTVHPQTLELSNVDMAREMVNMIVTQRGFQSNSKAVTTADEMLKKAMELKRQ